MIPSFSHGINVLAVLASGVGSLVIGFIWYGPLFGKPWGSYTGWTDQKVKTVAGGQMALTYILSFLAAIAQAIVLTVFVRAVGVATWGNGLWTGLLAGVGFIALAHVQHDAL